MTNFPRSPQLVKAGLVQFDTTTNRVLRIIALQYNPESLTRSLQAQGVQEGGERSQALRLVGPPQETYTLEALLDAADQLEQVQQPAAAAARVTPPQLGILPQLAVLEAILYPESQRMEDNNRLASVGTLEIVPAEAPLTIFVWSRYRTLPVRLNEISITEQAFSPDLIPLRAKINLTMRVLNFNDLGFDHRGGSLFLEYHRRIERLSRSVRGRLQALGVNSF